MKLPEITIVGLGGVGGYFGFKLAQNYTATSAATITFVARAATYEVVKQHGLTLLSAEHSVNVVRPDKLAARVSDLQQVSTLVLCVKEYDLEAICEQLKPLVRPDTVILPLMNGVDIYERIRRILPTGIVLPACVYVASHIKEKGVVEHKGNPGRIIVGNDPLHVGYSPAQLVGLLAGAGIVVDYQEDAFPAIWTKFFFIASFGLVCARYNKSIGQVEQEPVLHERAARIMQEIAAIAHRKSIDLPADIIDQTFQKARSFPYHTPTSLQLDVHSGKAHTELALFAGAILNYGAALGIPTEETTKIQAEIEAMMALRSAVIPA